MTDDHTTGYDQRGWGYGLAAWVLAAYTAEGDIVLDLDADPGIRIATEGMHRAYLSGLTPADAPGTPLAGVRLVTAHWPRSHTTPAATRSGMAPEGAVLTAFAGLLVPGAWLAVVVPLPAVSQPFTVHAEPLLSAAHTAGMGHLRAVHVTAADTMTPGDPAFRCALIFRRAGHPHHPGAGPSPHGPRSLPMDDELLTPDEVCAYLKINKDWLYDQVQAHRIPYIRLGRQLRFRRTELDDFLQAHANGDRTPRKPQSGAYGT